jgi:hypothetical protein
MPSPVFSVVNLTAPDRYIGAQSAALPCSAGDTVTLTASIQYLSGGMQPIIGVWFWDITQTTNYGSVRICPPNTDTGWHVYTFTVTVPSGAALMTVQSYCEYLSGSCYFVGWVPVGTGPSGSASVTEWAVSDYRVTQNGEALAVPLTSFSTATGFSYSQSQQFVFPLYYLSLFTSEYKSAPNLYAWASTLIGPTMDMLAFTQEMYGAFNLADAVGPQLDIIGAIVGANRQLPFQPVSGAILSAQPHNLATGYSIGDVLGVTQSGASAGTVKVTTMVSGHVTGLSVVTGGTGYTTATGLATTGGGGGGTLTVNITASSPNSAILSDSDFRTLIYAKIAQNQWNGSIASIYTLWNQIYPGSRMTFIDNQNMTCTIILASSTLTSLQLQMIENGLILPRPQGVEYDFTTAMEPIFGFDLSNSVIAGFDLGNFI